MADTGTADISRITEKHLEHFAVDGLRTLCIAERELDETLYKVMYWEDHLVGGYGWWVWSHSDGSPAL